MPPEILRPAGKDAGLQDDNRHIKKLDREGKKIEVEIG